jgi:quercetin dioxygenase-like cupin family protein
MLSLGVAASTLVIPTMATAQAPAGKELAPGVRQVDLGERPSLIPTYKTVRMRDIVIAPGASTPERDMMNDMVCHMTEGELAVVQNKKEFTVKKGDVWSCACFTVPTWMRRQIPPKSLFGLRLLGGLQ